MMSWKATLTKVEKRGGMVYPTVDFSDASTGETITQVFQSDNIDATALARLCENKIVSLEARDAAFGTLQPGDIALPRDTPDAAKLAADDFFAKLTALNALNKQVEKGIIKADDAGLAAAAADMKSAFKPEYATDIRFK